MNKPESYWSLPVAALIQQLQSSDSGISDEEAFKRKKANVTPPPRSSLVTDLLLLLSQFKSPLVLILIFAGPLCRVGRKHKYIHYSWHSAA